MTADWDFLRRYRDAPELAEDDDIKRETVRAVLDLEQLLAFTIPREWIDLVQIGALNQVLPPRRQEHIVPELRLEWQNDRLILEFRVQGTVIVARYPLLYEPPKSH